MKGTELLGVKLQEQKIARDTMRLNAELHLKDLENKKAETKSLIKKYRTEARLRKQKIIEEKQATLQKLKDLKAIGAMTDEEYNRQVQQVEDAAEIAIKATDQEIKAADEQADIEEKKLAIIEQEITATKGQMSELGRLTQAYQGFAGVLSGVASRIKDVLTIMPKLIQSFKEAQVASEAEGTSLRSASAAYIPFIG